MTQELITSIVIALGAFGFGWITALAWRPKTKSDFIRQEIWAVEDGIRGFDPIDLYDHCHETGQIVEIATDPEMTYFVFDIYSEGNSFIAEIRNDLANQIEEEFRAMEGLIA